MPGPDPRQDMALLTDAAKEAGAIARRFFRAGPETWDKGGGAGPVTEADLAVDTMLRESLLAARPGYGWLSEETEDGAERLTTKRQFIVDPIDGTQAFIDGTTAFAHSLAVVEDGDVLAAAVYLPMQDKMYAAAKGTGAVLNEAPLHASTVSKPNKASLLATKHTLSDRHWRKGVPPVHRVYRPSLAYRLALVGQGRFDGMATFRPTWEWDIAAGALIVSEAGGVASDGKGSTLRFNNPLPQVNGVLAAGPILHKALVAARG